MAIQETSTASHPVVSQRRQVFGFALIWTAVTLLVGAGTFVAIYAATGLVVNNVNSSNGAPHQALPAPAVVGFDATQSATDTATLGAIASNTPLVPPSQPAAIALQVTATPAGGATNVAATAAPTQESGASVQSGTAAATQGSNPTATIPAVKDTAFDLGIQVQPNADAPSNPKTYDLWMQMVAPQLKLNWLKNQVLWSDMEPTKGQIDFSTLDVTLPLAAKYNIKVLLSIVRAPKWAREPGADLPKNGPPATPQDYVDFVPAIVNRYPGQVSAIEVWNEQNLDREWASPKGLQATQYVALLSATYKAVKAIDPNILILSGALSPVSVSDPPRFYDDFVYMDAMIKAGMLNTVDCVGAHHNGINLPPTVEWQDAPRDPKGQRSKFRGPYDNPHHEWSFKSTLEGYHSRIAAAGSSLKLCVTEFGWASMQGITLPNSKTQAPPPVGCAFAADNTLANQAQYTTDAIDEMMGWGWVRLAFVWNLNYGAQSNWDPKNDNVPYSILGPGFSPRPVWQNIVNYDFRDQPRTATP